MPHGHPTVMPEQRDQSAHGPRDEDTLQDRSQEVQPEDADVLANPHPDDETAAEAAEQADPGATGVDTGA